MIVPGWRFVAILHQQAHSGGRGKNARHAKFFHDLPEEFGTGVIHRPFKGKRGRAQNQWGVDYITVTDHPTNVGGGPPDIGRLQAKDPLGHATDVYLVAAVSVNGQLGFGRRTGCREDVGWLIRSHRHIITALTACMVEEVLPGNITPRLHRSWFVSAFEYDHVFDTSGSNLQGGINNR